jgi:cell division protein FtsI (penicillin-binding protein 3)
MAILEDKVLTSTIYDTNGGEIRYSGKAVRDSHKGLWKISLARGFELSSNTVMVRQFTKL